MTVDKAELDLLLVVVNYLLTGGIKNLASWLKITISGVRTVVLSGVISAVLITLTTIYGMGEPLTIASFVHFLVVFLGSAGVYQAINSNLQVAAAVVARAIPPATQIVDVAKAEAKSEAKPDVKPHVKADVMPVVKADVKPVVPVSPKRPLKP